MMRNSFSLLLFWPVLFPAAVRPSLDAGAALDLDGSLALLRRSLRRLRSDRSEGDFEPQDAEEAAGVSELTMYMANFTKEKCGELHEKEGKDENTTKLLEKMKDVCEEEDADQVVSKINVHVSDPFFAQFLCGGLNLFTVNEMTYTELLQCQFAGNSILGGLEDCATTARQQDAKVFALKFGLYAIKVSAIFLPLPPPLGLLVHKAADMALARLSKEAESQLEALERRMDANMRALLTEELLRLGTAQARTAEEQVQEMSILDALWSDILQNEATNKVSSKFAAAMAHASSFNRWAIIEQDLSTSSELLRPTSSMVNVEERADFARLLKTQLEMYILVLSHMYRAAQESKHAAKFQKTLMIKAQRMSRMLLPELILLKRSSPDAVNEKTLEALNSPLLLPEKSETCKEMALLENFQFEYLISCIWFPLLHLVGPGASGPEDYAWPMTIGGVIEPITRKNKRNRCILYPDDAIFNGKKANRTKGYDVSCEGDDIIEEFHQKYVPRTVRKDKESIHFWCGQRWRKHHIELFPGTVFETPGLCLDFVRFFQWDTLGVLTAVEFDEVQKNQRTKIKRSTCRLAFRTSKKPYKIPSDWKKLTHHLDLNKVETLCEYLERFDVVTAVSFDV
mmetsp:Transcript_68057/g.138026  ORF Transcript_68057/g.138026 Transcript_68057/m.138026 type:complete len:625 (-) Transcript_68057:46-1920(-)